MNYYRLLITGISLIRRVLDIITQCIFAFIYNGPSDILPPISDPLLLESATSLAHKIRIGKLRSRTLVEAFISRIKEVQPIINAIVDERFDAALQDADTVDKLIASKSKSEQELLAEKPFLGVPFTTKDSIAVKGLSHTAGLVARKGLKGENDSAVIDKMRNSGAIPLAVTNISEMCMWWESNNNIYGRTNNPYHTSHIVGGSSGGEAAILAAAGSVIGIGSDVGGSIRMPAFFCGIFGHKASTGIVDTSGQIPVAENEILTYLSSGPMCRHATDLKPILKIVAGINSSQLKLDSKVDLASLKIYYTSDEITNPIISPVCNELKEVQMKVLKHFQVSFGTKPQKLSLRKLHHGFEMWSCLMATAEAPSFCAELAQRNGKINPFWELLKWFFGCSPHTFPAICLGFTEKTSPSKDSEAYNMMNNICTDLRCEIQEILGNDGVLFFASHPETAPYHNQPIFKPLNFVYTAIFNVLGFPVTQCPLGLSKNGLPLGVQVVGNFNNDHLTLAVAVELEKAFGGWVPPSVIL